MFKTKFIATISLLIFFLTFTSLIKNKTRILEKKITNLNFKLLSKQNDTNEAQLDFFYLTSPAEIERRLKIVKNENYYPISFSKIYFNISDFTKMQNKISNNQNSYEKKTKTK